MTLYGRGHVSLQVGQTLKNGGNEMAQSLPCGNDWLKRFLIVLFRLSYDSYDATPQKVGGGGDCQVCCLALDLDVHT